MPARNITIDNTSPLIRYQPVGSWQEGTSADPFFANYSDSTFTLSTDLGASASFTFNGTGIWLFGAKRPNHGLYNVTLDGETTTFNGSSPNNIFQEPLFSQTGLENTLHTIALTNAGVDPVRTNDYLDVDFITWESSIGTADEQVQQLTVQDTGPGFSYEPQSAWNTNPAFLSSFFGRSGHTTTTGGASTTLTFTGVAIQIFGTCGPDDAPYTVQLDDGTASTFNATKSSDYQQVLIYYADNLGPGTHEVTITNFPAIPNQSLNINYALVDKISSGHSSLSDGAIAGIVIGGIAVVGVLVTLLFVLRKRRRRSEETPEKPIIFQPVDFDNIPEEPNTVPTQFPLDLSQEYNMDSKSNPLSIRNQEMASISRQGSNISGYSNPTTLYSSSPSRPEGRVRTYSNRPLPPCPTLEPEGPQDIGHIPTPDEMPPPDYSQATKSQPYRKN